MITMSLDNFFFFLIVSAFWEKKDNRKTPKPCVQLKSVCIQKTTSSSALITQKQEAAGSGSGPLGRVLLSERKLLTGRVEAPGHWGKDKSVPSAGRSTHFFLLTLGFLTGRRYGLSIILSSLLFAEGTTPLGGSKGFSLSAVGSSCMGDGRVQRLNNGNTWY